MNSVQLVCPSCKVNHRPKNDLCRVKFEKQPLCQGCRAGNVLSERPWLLPLYVEFWKRNGFPASPSWMKHLGNNGPVH